MSKNIATLKFQSRGNQGHLKVSIRYTGYSFLLVFYFLVTLSLTRTVFEIFHFKNAVTLKPVSKTVRQGH